MEARLIQAGFLPRESLFRPDLVDWGVELGRPPPPLSLPLPGQASNTTPPTPIPGTAAPRVAPLYLLDKGLRAWAAPAAELQDAEHWATVSPELLNYGLALLVYAVRYPAVFWRGNKTFGALFSIQLVANGAQIMLAFVGASALYKVQVFGARDALPTSLGAAVLRATKQAGQHEAGMLLSPGLTLGLLCLATMLVLASSLVLYLYGYGRLHAFLQTEAAKKVIRVRPRSHGWVCFTHCSALCVLVCACVAEAPLVHDWTVLYRGSLDAAVLVTLCACILHLLCWVALWLLLTVKHKWTFKLRVTVARAVVRSARSVRLCTDVELLSGRRPSHVPAAGQPNGQLGGGADPAAEPLLVVGNGRAYTVTDAEPRHAILGAIAKSQQERRARQERLNGQLGGAARGPTGPGAGPASVAVDTAQPGVYWLRHGGAQAGAEGAAWMGRKASKPKVTFDETATRRRHDANSPPVVDDGDYAMLQELPLVTQMPSNAQVTAPSSATSVSDRSEASSSSSGCATMTGSPPHHQSDHSDTSGVHSTSSASSGGGSTQQRQYQQLQQQARRANSVADLCLEPARQPAPPQYKSLSLTRGAVPPGPTTAVATLPTLLKLQNQPIYSSIRKPSQGVTLRPPQPAPDDESPPPPAPPEPQRPSLKAMPSLQPQLQPVREVAENGVPHLNSHDDTVVIRRHKRNPDPGKDGDVEDMFGRATNMRMTSFTDQPDSGPYGPIGRASGFGFASGSAATLPLPPPPPPPPATQSHCATLPAHSSSIALQQQQQQQQQQQLAGSCGNFVRQHSTIPTHHNGVLLYQPGHLALAAQHMGPLHGGQPRGLASLSANCFKDHSMSPSLKYGLQQHLHQHLRSGVGLGGATVVTGEVHRDLNGTRRDSASFSVVSSGDGEFAH